MIGRVLCLLGWHDLFIRYSTWHGLRWECKRQGCHWSEPVRLTRRSG